MNYYAKKITRGALDAEDIAQEAMVKILRSPAVPQQIGSAWLFKVIKNCMIDTRKRFENRRADLFSYLDPTCREDESVYTLSTDDPTYRLHYSLELRKILSSLTDPLKEAVMLYAAGYSYQEIACATNQNIGTVRSRIYYARKQAKRICEM